MGTTPEIASAAARNKELEKVFYDAMDAMGNADPIKAEALWTRAIELAPELSPSWSNRGTLKLQRGRWEEAAADLQRARELEEAQVGQEGVNSLVLNNLGNCKGALGDWDGAKADYLAAAKDPSMEEVARANYALALFQTGDDKAALKEARQLVRRDPQFWDMRAATTAFLWGLGDEAGAENEWEKLKNLGGGLGAALYDSTNRVKARWPPRCTAALEAFLALERSAKALDYDGQMKEFRF